MLLYIYIEIKLTVTLGVYAGIRYGVKHLYQKTIVMMMVIWELEGGNFEPK